jgi:hypothetical protein
LSAIAPADHPHREERPRHGDGLRDGVRRVEDPDADDAAHDEQRRVEGGELAAGQAVGGSIDCGAAA